MRAIFTCTFLALVALPAGAETLLATLTQKGGYEYQPCVAGSGQPCPPPVEPTNAVVGGAAHDPATGEWPYASAAIGGDYLPDDAGLVIEPSPADMATWRHLLTLSNVYDVYIGMSFGRNHQGMLVTPDDIFSGNVQPDFSLSSRAFVPQLGEGFIGYDVSRLTLTIDSLTNRWDGSRYYVTGQQTLSFYGEAQHIPEPASGLIACAAIVLFACRGHIARRHVGA